MALINRNGKPGEAEAASPAVSRETGRRTTPETGNVTRVPAPSPAHTPAPTTATEKAPEKAPEKVPEKAPETATESDGIATDFITGGAFMLAPELADASAPVRARNEKQMAMDAKVKQLHETWIRAGRPNTWEKQVESKTVATYFVEPEKVPELHKLINRAVTFVSGNGAGVRARMGTPFKVTEAHIKRHGLPAHYLGREAVSFAVLDKRARATTSNGTPAGEVVREK